MNNGGADTPLLLPHFQSGPSAETPWAFCAVLRQNSRTLHRASCRPLLSHKQIGKSASDDIA